MYMYLVALLVEKLNSPIFASTILTIHFVFTPRPKSIIGLSFNHEIDFSILEILNRYASVFVFEKEMCKWISVVLDASVKDRSHISYHTYIG